MQINTNTGNISVTKKELDALGIAANVLLTLAKNTEDNTQVLKDAAGTCSAVALKYSEYQVTKGA